MKLICGWAVGLLSVVLLLKACEYDRCANPYLVQSVKMCLETDGCNVSKAELWRFHKTEKLCGSSKE